MALFFLSYGSDLDKLRATGLRDRYRSKSGLYRIETSEYHPRASRLDIPVLLVLLRFIHIYGVMRQETPSINYYDRALAVSRTRRQKPL